MRTLFLLLSLVAAAVTVFVPALSSSMDAAEKDQVRLQAHGGVTSKTIDGENNVYYCGVPHEQQIFSIGLIDFSPDPPEFGKRLFMFMEGSAKSAPEGINDTRLRLTVRYDDQSNFTQQREDRLLNFPQLAVRYDGGHTLDRLGTAWTEFVADLPLTYPFDAGRYTITADARLPDGQTYFCIGMKLDLREDHS